MHFQEQKVLLAFGEDMMLTRGFETLHDDNCVENWKSIINAKVEVQEGKGKAIKSPVNLPPLLD